MLSSLPSPRASDCNPLCSSTRTGCTLLTYASSFCPISSCAAGDKVSTFATASSSCGPVHPSVARDLNNLARLLQDTNRPAEAEPLYRRALAINENSYGRDHPDVAANLHNLAFLLRATNRLSEAEPLVRRAVGILAQFGRATGHQHPNFESVRANYAQALIVLGRSEAEIEAALRLDRASGREGIHST
jgi:tetratricopeptide (TPR) repeat protein